MAFIFGVARIVSTHQNKESLTLFSRLKEDIKAFRDRDPAARSDIEIFLLYPGFKAIRMHRRAHWFYKHNMKFIARAISQKAVRKTGIEIHPGATIGRRLVIDHGTGIVIGETAEIGDDVLIYQGVTLGGTGKDTGKRHPTIGNGVMIGSGAKVLGPFKVGDNSNIASGAVVLDEIPPNSTAVGVPARVIKRNGKRVDNLDQVHIPDPVSQEFCRLNAKIEKLEKELAKYKKISEIRQMFIDAGYDFNEALYIDSDFNGNLSLNQELLEEHLIFNTQKDQIGNYLMRQRRMFAEDMHQVRFLINLNVFKHPEIEKLAKKLGSG